MTRAVSGENVGAYSDPYLAGVGLGLVLLTAYVVVGHGIGASGGFSTMVASGTAAAIGTARASASPAMAPYLPDGIASPLRDWLVLELVGVAIGGFCSAWLAGRVRGATERGPRIGSGQRLGAALAGGLLMGFGAKLARGCTSGQALTGGALLAAGSWIFIITCFASGYLAAPVMRRLWR
jgi:uncharacterized membrane protein YedE/YeeE